PALACSPHQTARRPLLNPVLCGSPMPRRKSAHSAIPGPQAVRQRCARTCNLVGVVGVYSGSRARRPGTGSGRSGNGETGSGGRFWGGGRGTGGGGVPKGGGWG